ncbi:MAG: hypothetical protein V4689_21535 [Verrucomicrobiota bacterium]
MKFLFLPYRLIAAFFLTITQLSAWEPLKPHPENPGILEFRGKPEVLFTFAEHYGSVVNTDFDFIPYLDIMQRDGMNLTRIFLAGFRHDNRVPSNDPLAPMPAAFLQPWKRDTTGNTSLDGLGKWDFTQ